MKQEQNKFGKVTLFKNQDIGWLFWKCICGKSGQVRKDHKNNLKCKCGKVPNYIGDIFQYPDSN